MQSYKHIRVIGSNSAAIAFLTGVACALGPLAMSNTAGQEVKAELPKEKQTTLGLYLIAKEAYERSRIPTASSWANVW